MPLSDNLILANEAIKYVKLKLPYGSANREQDKKNPARYQEALRRIKLSSEDLDEYFYRSRRNPDPHKDTSLLKAFRVQAEFAREYQAGNCGDQALVGYFYLIDTLKTIVRSLSVVLIFDDEGAQHTLFLIGAPNSKDAVLCDPYEDEAYAAGEYFEHAAHKWGNRVFIRLELGENEIFNQENRQLYNLGTVDLLRPPTTIYIDTSATEEKRSGLYKY